MVGIYGYEYRSSSRRVLQQARGLAGVSARAPQRGLVQGRHNHMNETRLRVSNPTIWSMEMATSEAPNVSNLGRLMIWAYSFLYVSLAIMHSSRDVSTLVPLILGIIILKRGIILGDGSNCNGP